jgi:hypothetical protein
MNQKGASSRKESLLALFGGLFCASFSLFLITQLIWWLR